MFRVGRRARGCYAPRMWRVLLVAAAITASADARPVRTGAPHHHRTHHHTRHRHKHHATKHRLATKKKKTKMKTRRLKTLNRVTVEEQSVQLASVGRVRYEGELPPGFAWPASDDMRSVERGCEAELTAAGVEWQHADALGKIADPIVVPVMDFGGVAFRSKWDHGPFVIDCQLARMLARLGPKLRALGVTQVAFGSVYRNTLVRFGGKRGKALSRHALGLAMDVVAFTDASGRVVTIGSDYPKKDWLLLAIENLVDHDRDWRILLTPKNDPISHKDHFHLEASVDFRGE